MRTYCALVSILVLIAAANISHADNNNDAGHASSQVSPPTTVASLAHQPLTSAGAVDNLANLSDEQVEAQLAALKTESARRKHLHHAKPSGSSANSNAGQSKGNAKPAKTATGDTARFQKLYLREIGYPKEALAAPPSKP